MKTRGLEFIQIDICAYTKAILGEEEDNDSNPWRELCLIVSITVPSCAGFENVRFLDSLGRSHNLGIEHAVLISASP